MEEKQKTAGELRREALLYQPKNGYDRLSAQDEADMKRGPHRLPPAGSQAQPSL